MRLKIIKVFEYKTYTTDIQKIIFGTNLKELNTLDSEGFHAKQTNHFHNSTKQITHFKGIAISKLIDIVEALNDMHIDTNLKYKKCPSIIEMLNVGKLIQEKYDVTVEFEGHLNDSSTMKIIIQGITVIGNSNSIPKELSDFFKMKFKAAHELFTNEKFCYAWWD